jgi:hypothetical protein
VGRSDYYLGDQPLSVSVLYPVLEMGCTGCLPLITEYFVPFSLTLWVLIDPSFLFHRKPEALLA